MISVIHHLGILNKFLQTIQNIAHPTEEQKQNLETGPPGLLSDSASSAS